MGIPLISPFVYRKKALDVLEHPKKQEEIHYEEPKTSATIETAEIPKPKINKPKKVDKSPEYNPEKSNQIRKEVSKSKEPGKPKKVKEDPKSVVTEKPEKEIQEPEIPDYTEQIRNKLEEQKVDFDDQIELGERLQGEINQVYGRSDLDDETKKNQVEERINRILASYQNSSKEKVQPKENQLVNQQKLQVSKKPKQPQSPTIAKTVRDSSKPSNPKRLELDAKVEGWLNESSEDLGHEQKSYYHKTMNEVLNGMNETSIDFVHKNLKKIIFCKSVKDLNKYAEKFGLEVDPKLFYGGMWDDETGELYLDGDYGKEQMEDFAKHPYSHEIFHVIDKGEKFSGTPEWKTVWEDEINWRHGPLSAYARKNQYEGFAEYGRLVINNPKVARHFKKCWDFVVKNGLVDENYGQA